MNKLKQRWRISSNFQLVVIFFVFALNGSLSAKISVFFMNLLGFNIGNLHWFFYYLILMILVLPLYPFLLIAIGFLFGQFEFFFKFSKKMLKSMGLGFVFNS
jgi:manganese efflux pump family protein